MKALTYISIVVAVVSIIVGVILAATGKQFPPIGLLAETFMDFTKVCLLFAVAFGMLELLKTKK